jgi:hypothetical protein
MITASRSLLSLWDYGWCDHARLPVTRTNVAADIIREYLRSDDFGTSFVGPQLDSAPELHGPFRRALISESDFELVSPERFLELIAVIRFPEGFSEPVSDEHWQEIQKLTSELRSRHSWFFALRFTEDDSTLFHEWGSVLTIFREFICASPDSDFAERLVFGYD